MTQRDRKLVGSNTDWIGAVRAIERMTPIAGTQAVVLGAGGAARAVVYGLRERGAKVSVLNRTLDRAKKLADDLGADSAGSIADLARLPHDILVNTTSVGLGADESPINASWISPDAVVMDAVYDPPKTRLLRDAAT